MSRGLLSKNIFSAFSGFFLAVKLSCSFELSMVKVFFIPGPGYIASRHESFPLKKKMLFIFKCSMKKHDNAHSYRDQ